MTISCHVLFDWNASRSTRKRCHSFKLYFHSRVSNGTLYNFIIQFVTDQTTKAKGPPRWLEPDQVLPVQGRVGEDIIVEPKLRWSDVFDELRFEL